MSSQRGEIIFLLRTYKEKENYKINIFDISSLVYRKIRRAGFFI